ncbi:MAG: VanW family protein [Flavobacteriales bacterium]
MTNIQKPIIRSPLRQTLGKEYFILKRKMDWLFGKQKWARQVIDPINGHSVIKHQSMILRPLKDVDMYLQENKRTNLKLAVDRLNLTVIKPGETFSLWKQVGRPTKSKGYLDGLVLNQGNVDKGTGGGLCQLGNLLFWIFAHSPISITERHRHGFDVFPDVNRTVPFGAGATLSYNYIDLQVKNETDTEFQIHLWLDHDYLHGELFSSNKLTSKYRIEEENHLMKQQMWGGYSRHNQIIKVETDENGTETKTLLVENHALTMYNPFLEEKK